MKTVILASFKRIDEHIQKVLKTQVKWNSLRQSLFYKKIFIYVSIYFGCAESSLLCTDFSSYAKRGLLPSCSVSAFLCRGFSCCGLQALSTSVAVARGSVAPRRVESPHTRDWTHVPCIGRQILNHWTTREVPVIHYPLNFQKTLVISRIEHSNYLSAYSPASFTCELH